MLQRKTPPLKEWWLGKCRVIMLVSENRLKANGFHDMQEKCSHWRQVTCSSYCGHKLLTPLHMVFMWTSMHAGSEWWMNDSCNFEDTAPQITMRPCMHTSTRYCIGVVHHPWELNWNESLGLSDKKAISLCFHLLFIMCSHSPPQCRSTSPPPPSLLSSTRACYRSLHPLAALSTTWVSWVTVTHSRFTEEQVKQSMCAVSCWKNN